MYKDVFLCLIDCAVLQLYFWTCSYPVLTLFCIIINFHIVRRLRVAKMLWLGISSVLECRPNVCMLLLLLFITFVHCLLLWSLLRYLHCVHEKL